MRGSLTQLVVAFLIGLVVPAIVYSDDLAQIQANFEAEVKALNALDQNAFVTSADEDVVLFGVLSPFAVEGKAAFRDTLERYVAHRQATAFTPIKPKFRIMGESALAWGHFQLVDQMKGAPPEMPPCQRALAHASLVTHPLPMRLTSG